MSRACSTLAIALVCIVTACSGYPAKVMTDEDIAELAEFASGEWVLASSEANSGDFDVDCLSSFKLSLARGGSHPAETADDGFDAALIWCGVQTQAVTVVRIFKVKTYPTEPFTGRGHETGFGIACVVTADSGSSAQDAPLVWTLTFMANEASAVVASTAKVEFGDSWAVESDASSSGVVSPFAYSMAPPTAVFRRAK